MSQVCRFMKLPPAVQQEVANRLKANGYGDYEQIALDLRRRGYRISKSSLHRYVHLIRTDAEFLRAWALEHPERAAVVVAALKAEPAAGLKIDLPPLSPGEAS